MRDWTAYEGKNRNRRRTVLVGDHPGLLNAADCFREPRSRLRRRVDARSRALVDGSGRAEEHHFSGSGRIPRLQLLAGCRTSKEDAVRAR